MRTRLIAASVAVLAVLSLGVGVAAPAEALQAPVNPTDYELAVTPSTVRAAVTGASGTMTEAQAAALLLNRARFSVTGQRFAIAATKAAPFVKGAAAVTVALPAGVALGSGWDQQMFGIDVAGSLCSPAPNGAFQTVNNLLASLGAADCTAWQLNKFMNQLGQTPNSDVASVGTLTSAPICTNGGTTLCTQVYGTAQYQGHTIYCMRWDNSTNPISFWAQFSGGPGFVRFDTVIAAPGNLCGLQANYPPDPTWPAGGWQALMPSVYGLTDQTLTAIRQGTAGTPVVPSPVTNGDPQRTFRCDVTLSGGTTISTSTTNWDEASGTAAAPKCPSIGSSQVPTSTKVVETTPGKPDIVVQPSTPTTPAYQTWKTAYPECGTGTCLLDLKYKGQSCFQVPAPCDGWMADPSLTTDYTCTYGTHSVALSECYAYAPTFTPSKVAAGQPYGDTATGADVQGQTGPSSDDGLNNAPIVNPDTQQRSCFPTGWAAFNPLNWVLQPVGCALQDAFVARPSVVTAEEADLQNTWNATAPAKLAAAIGGVMAAFGTLSDGGCSGIVVDLSGIGPNILHLSSYHFLPACPGDFFAPWAPLFKAFLYGVFTLVAFFGGKRLISELVGLTS